MESMTITVLSIRRVNDEIHARVRADSPPHARLHIELWFPAREGESPWVTAYDGRSSISTQPE